MRRMPALCAALALLGAAAAGDEKATQSGAIEMEGALAEALDLSGDGERGSASYAENCAFCHGPKGAGRSDGTFPRLAGQHRSVLVKQLVDIRSGRRANPIMKPHADALLDAQQIADVAAYATALPPPDDVGLGDGKDLEHGGALYRRECAGCHGPRGEGDAERLVPMLAGQHYAYLLRQIRAVAAGRRGNAHPAMRLRVAEHDDAALRALVDYASRLSEAAADPAP